MKELLLALLLFVGGCVTAIDRYDAINCAFLADDITVEQYNALMTPTLLKAVQRESAYSMGGGWRWGCPPPPPIQCGVGYVR